ncbi:MAG: hypothetical protein JO299_03710 [Gammaproteobacteria bacterium]|nr:hypothetical protein [Gammaproteobacteria bacterium]
MRIVNGATFGTGTDVIAMPRYFKTWEQGLPKLREQLTRLDDIRYFSKPEKQLLRTRLSQRGITTDEQNALIMWGGSRRVLAIFDPSTLRIKALLKAD